jgi:hypothetical protein
VRGDADAFEPPSRSQASRGARADCRRADFAEFLALDIGRYKKLAEDMGLSED